MKSSKVTEVIGGRVEGIIWDVIKSDFNEFIKGGIFDPTEKGEDMLLKAYASADGMFFTDAVNADTEVEQSMFKFLTTGVKEWDFEQIMCAGEVYAAFRSKFIEHALSLTEFYELDSRAERAYKEVQTEIWENSMSPEGKYIF